MRRRLLLIAAMLFALGACSAAGSSTDGGAPFTVDGPVVRSDTVDLPRSYRFDPAAIEIATGTAVTWTNSDNFVHNVSLKDGSDRTVDLPIGGTATITFDEAGVFYYECSLHPSQMRGKIVVKG